MKSVCFQEMKIVSRILLNVLLVFGSLSFCTVALGQQPLEGTVPTMDPRAVGMAGTVRAAPSGTAGVYMNPATIAMAKLFHISLNYKFTGPEELHQGGIAAVDAITSRSIAAGVAVNYLRINETDTDHEVWDARLALAGNFGDLFYLGMTGRYIRVEHDLEGGNTGPNGTRALQRSGSRQLDGFTFDAGGALRLGRVISLGLVGYNLTNTESAYAPIKLGGGVSAALMGMLLLEVDLAFDFTSFEETAEELSFGFELLLAQSFPLRLGYKYDVYFNTNSIAAGLGYVSTAFAIDLGYQHEIKESGRFQLAFGIRIFLN